MMVVHPSGYYAWKANPISARQKEDQRLSGLIKQFWLESGGVYGYRKITGDLRDEGERCGKHRVYRLMRAEGLRSQTGYRACTEFCVNGLLAGNCRIVWRHNEREETCSP